MSGFDHRSYYEMLRDSMSVALVKAVLNKELAESKETRLMASRNGGELNAKHEAEELADFVEYFSKDLTEVTYEMKLADETGRVGTVEMAEEFLNNLPSTYVDAIVEAKLLTDAEDVKRMTTSVMEDYLSAATAAPQNWKDTKPLECELCGREVRLTYHHLIPAADPGGSQFGVNVLSPGTDPVVDIILVHGLGGDPFKTWTHSNGKKDAGVLWPRDLLAREIPEVRVLSYGYDTKVTSWFEGATSNMIHHHSETMISRLHNFRSRKIDGKNSTERPIIWIGHSLGGILIKRALIYSNSCGVDHNERLRSIRVSTQGVLFMGTPHMGSDIVKWGSMARKLLSFFPGVRLDSTMLSMLGQNSETLQNINTLFTGVASSFEIVYFYEELETLLPTGQHEIIVPYSSAIVDSPNTEKIGIHGTHHTMVKFRDDSSPGYSDVAGILRQMVDNAVTFAPGRWEAERRSAVAATHDKIKGILIQRGASGLYFGAASPRSLMMGSPRRLSGRPESVMPVEVEEIGSDSSTGGAPSKRLAITQGEGPSTSSSLILPPSLPIFAVPLHPNESPVTREYLLKDFDATLLNDERRSKGNAGLLLWGPPGSGKTHLVREYVFTRREFYTGGIFWVNARTAASRADSFRNIYKKLNLPSAVMQDVTAPHADRSGMDVYTCRVLEWMERTENWLLVLDAANAVDEAEIDDIKACMPTSRGSSILFTTLNQSLDGQARLGAPVGYKIPQMTLREAVSILLTEAKIADPTPQEIKVAGELVELLDYLIGAIHIAACYIAERQVSIYEYLRGYKEHPKVSGDGWSPLAMTLDTLETKHPEAANLLKLISYFGADTPTLLIHWGLEALPAQVRVVAKEEDGMFDFNLTIKHLLAFSLVRRTHQKESENRREWRVDRLHLQSVIQTYVRQRLNSQPDVGRAWVKFAALVFRHAFERAEKQRGLNGGIYVKDYEEFVVHGESLAARLREQKVSRRSIRDTIERAKAVIDEQNRAQEAGRLIEFPKRSIWGRTDMESPEAVYASRRSTFDCSSSVTGSSLSASTLSEISKGNAFSVGNNSKVTQEEQPREEKVVRGGEVSAQPANPGLSRASTWSTATVQPSISSATGKRQGKKLQRRPSHRSYRSRQQKEAKGKQREAESNSASVQPPVASGSVSKSVTIGTQTSDLYPGLQGSSRVVPLSEPASTGYFPGNSQFSFTSHGAASTPAVSPREVFGPLSPNVPQVYTNDLIRQSAPSNLNYLYRKSELPNTLPAAVHRTLSEPVRDPGPDKPLPRTIRRRKAVDYTSITQGKDKVPRLEEQAPTVGALSPMVGYYYPDPQNRDSTQTGDIDDSDDGDFVTVTSEPGPSRLSRAAMRHKIMYNTPASSTAAGGLLRVRSLSVTAKGKEEELFLSAPTSPHLSHISSIGSDASSMRPAPGSLVDLARNFATWTSRGRSRSRGSSMGSSATRSPSPKSTLRDGGPRRVRQVWERLE
ncbi:hypothetical protein Dda_2634 [Drechslerella dactyloides]|uniref:NB-ARC domain-containing protein n=1 Tax=Drechslerella dactyloides TaxID=74499 RepID=A0AAD6NKY6_DREDA|nr:hypothetical protein Dda_2634 [Drechslerella dactyloides]